MTSFVLLVVYTVLSRQEVLVPIWSTHVRTEVVNEDSNTTRCADPGGNDTVDGQTCFPIAEVMLVVNNARTHDVLMCVKQN
mmetsp:Transcript_4711/g.12348  ORF Transcript_4711/g.12348 Transcript_4711/m.12348 type:complete len:81 (-) Transcript_4711:1223-1465(-)